MQIAHCIIKGLHHFRTIFISMFRATTQHFVNDIDNGAWYVCTQSTKGSRISFKTRNCSCLIVVALERNVSGQAFIENEAK